MNEFDFDKLKNLKIDFPESWVENALDIPSKEHKKPAPILFYRYSAVIAACVVLGAAVTLTMIFGIGRNNVNLTKPNTDYRSDSVAATDSTIHSGTDGYISPTDNPPAIFGTENDASTVVAESSENSGISNENDNSSVKNRVQNANKQAARGGTQSGGSKVPATASSGDTQPLTKSQAEPPAAQEPTEEPLIPEFTEPITVEPGAEGLSSYFITVVDESLAQGKIYCRIEDENGNIVDGSNKFSRSHSAIKYDLGDGTVRLTYLHYFEESGGQYNIIFYNSEGVVLKQGSAVIYTGRYHYI